MMKFKRCGEEFLKCKVDALCIAALGNKKLFNACFIGKLNKNGIGRVGCVITI